METDLESKVKELLTPYEERISQLEEDNKRKEIEISTLKHAIYDLSKLLESRPKGNLTNAQNKPQQQPQISKSQTQSNNKMLNQSSSTTQKTKKEEEKDNQIMPSMKSSELSEKSQKQIISQKQPKKSGVEKGGEGSIKADFGRTHQWVYPPSNYITQDPKIPQAQLEAYKIIGYNGKNSRHNLFFINDTTIVYCTASVVVIQDLNTLNQKTLVAHNNDINCIVYSPVKQVIASGQIDPKGEETPFICLWDIQGNLLKKLNFHKNSIESLAFSTDGNYLLSVGGDNEHSTAIWKWETQDKPEIQIANEKNKILGLIGISENSWAQFGEKHVRVLVFEKNQLQILKVIFGTSSIPKSCVCAVWINNKLWIGTDEGKILIFEERTCKQTVKAHEGPLTAMQKYKDPQDQLKVVTVGVDGQLMVWNQNAEKLLQSSWVNEEMKNILQGVALRPRAMDIQSNGQLIIGTTTNILVKSDLQGNSQILSASHYNNVNFVATHPLENKFATVGHDKILRIINIQESNLLGVYKVLEDKANTASFSLDGQHLAIGFEDGTLRIYAVADLTIQHQQKQGKMPIAHVKYSPDNQLIAVAAGNDIRLLKVNEGYQESQKLTGAVGHIKMVTFSKDSQFLFANTNSYELLYWSTQTGGRIDFHSQIRDVEWVSMNNINSWHVRGIWDSTYDGTDINFCSVNKEQKYLAIGDDFGKVKLFSYPCGEPQSPFKEFSGHSEHVSCVQWSMDSQYLVSTGGADNTVIVWKLMDKVEN